MLALITGTTLVQGLSGSNVEYIGCVQEDGYIYFNDQRFYRCLTPPDMSTTVDVDGSSVQMWYTQQNRWIRCNVFDTLKIKGFSSNEIQQAITDAKADALQAIADALAAATDAIDSLSKTLDNGDALLNSINSLNDVINVVNSYHSQSIPIVTNSVWHN